MEKYAKNTFFIGACSGVKEMDKNAYERKIWKDGFKAALKLIEKNKE